MVYEQTKSRSSNIQVEEYAPLVKRIAHHMMARMPSSVQVDDLIQAGMIGLIEASQKYDGSKGASFETYAGIRIRGAIVDEMRRGDWAPRSVHRNSRRVADAINSIEKRTGRDASDTEIAEEMHVSLDEYYEIAKDSVSTRLFSFDEAYEEDESKILHSDNEALDGPSEKVHQRAMREALVMAIDGLPEREKLVLSLYYEQELNLKEIGMVLEVSESRISQIHSQAAARLRARLKDWIS
ncbi:RNA polymerase sigma factor FliA [Agarilytica rhodophyticola]|uniref:RNA polymerase sigma factor FliA n=1 Tax=Agarilytica rhodophyticola TaxID=1737490 RepID=UPI000B343A26|nr:RNA polymerase sigma factor FliA [Agarilytica rhodophyticola]